jgi:large subunit ribosomal protein L3
MAAILGKKLGMTNIFDKEGHFIPVTLIEAGPCLVVGARTKEKSGYSAVVLGYRDVKDSKVNNAQLKWFKKLKVSPKRVIKEMRTDKDPACKVGDTIGVSIFKAGEYVDVRGTSIGKGFQGGMKRWNWHGGERGHGSMFHRAPGSIGASSYPSRVFKGQHLPGHMGNVKRTVQNLEVISVDEKKSLLTVRGGVPGPKTGLLVIKHAKKIPPKGAPRLRSGQGEQKDGKDKK